MQSAEAVFPCFQKKRSRNRSGDDFWYDRLRRDSRFHEGSGYFTCCISAVRANSLVASLTGSASGNNGHSRNRQREWERNGDVASIDRWPDCG